MPTSPDTYGRAVADEFTSTFHYTPSVYGDDRFDTLCGLTDLHPVVAWSVTRMDPCAACLAAMPADRMVRAVADLPTDPPASD